MSWLCDISYNPIFLRQKRTCDTCYNIIFYGEFERNIFILIWSYHDAHREGIPGKIQQEKLCFYKGHVIHVITLFLLANMMEILLS